MPQQEGFHFFGYGRARASGSAIPRHDGSALGADFLGSRRIDAHYFLRHFQAFVTNTGNLGTDLQFVTKKHLLEEINIKMDYHNGKIALFGRQAYRREECLFPKVKILHQDGIVDVPHLVYIIESDL